MLFEDSQFYKELKSHKLNLSFGKFYLFENFIVSEFNTGVHLDFDDAKILLNEVLKFYDENSQVVYISNRINDYSINPYIWSNWEQDSNFIIASAIVTYNYATYMNAEIEKCFASKTLKCFKTLSDAFEWATFKELKN